MNYELYNIFIGTETFIEGEGDFVLETSYGFYKNGIPYKIIKLGKL